MFNPFHPPPAPPAFGDGRVLPEASVSPISQLLFTWLGPFLRVGYSRPLEKEDLWSLPESRLTSSLSQALETEFYARCGSQQQELSTESAPDAEPDAPKTHGNTEDTASNQNKKGDQSVDSKSQGAEKPQPQYGGALLKAIHHIFIVRWWFAGVLKLLADGIRTTTPLITKALLNWLAEAYVFHQLQGQPEQGEIPRPRGIGYGIGLAVGLFVMQEAASLLTNYSTFMTMSIGLSARTATIGAIFRKSMRLSGRARLEHNVGQITTMISTDTTKIDETAALAHTLWIAPIQIIVGIALLIYNLGPSALVGLGVIIFGFPIQGILVNVLLTQRKKGLTITDARVRLMTEVLQGIRFIKLYAWEGFYAHNVGKLRDREVANLRKQAMALSLLVSEATFIPVLAIVLTFVTYALSGHELNAAIIFSSLNLFTVLNTPFISLPVVLAYCADTTVALGRIAKFLSAEEIDTPPAIDKDTAYAVDVDGDFTWETSRRTDANGTSAETKTPDAKAKQTQKSKRPNAGEGDVLPVANEEKIEKEGTETVAEVVDAEEKPFELPSLKLRIPKGAFVAIVGRVGSGKSSVLQALIGEMRRKSGNVTFGGTVAYAPQTPWIRNATLRENVTFGKDNDEQKFREVVRACSLDHDIESLPYGENTEIGEKGINLSGGQKARVSLARAAYSGSEIVLLDDPLSAVDAYVGKSILESCILDGPLAERTRILVTHALHVLDKTDYIYVMDNGCIAEHGTYKDLMEQGAIFPRVMEEYVNRERESGSQADFTEKTRAVSENALAPDADDTVNAVLMQAEERSVGAVAWEVYSGYLKFAGGIIWVLVILLLLVLNQVASVGTTLFLGFWTAESIPNFKQGDYMAVYASFGAAQAICSFLLCFVFAVASLVASRRMFAAALQGVMRSPVSFFDTTPIGRILSRLSKDQSTLDSELFLSQYSVMAIFASIFGSVGLVFYTFPYLGILFLPLGLVYAYVGSYYRRSSVETKRLDSLMRSSLYGSFSETLTGLSTIRAYGVQARSIQSADHGLDMENRAYYMTVSIQRWLSVRLDLLGNILIIGIALFAVGFKDTINPSKTGVVLSYTLGITIALSETVAQFAQNEQNMNAVERVLVYTDLPSEGDPATPNDPPASWPERGEIRFDEVALAYRPGLPLVLKGVSFNVKAGEKIGIVGRTGAGKSSLLQALFRMVELDNGKIEIDGRDIRNMGLDVLRSRLALVPQDTSLFMGTLRENLDPQRTRTDAELLSALQRVCLLPGDGTGADAKFSLDSVVGDDGLNFSAGERQLLALCRALVKNSRIIVLDEATSSIDLETDSKIQKTIQSEFATSTLLCIAHRLPTIAYCDRILVMDQGEVAEFDGVLDLFDRTDSIFRSLCSDAGLSRQDLLRLRGKSSNQ